MWFQHSESIKWTLTRLSIKNTENTVNYYVIIVFKNNSYSIILWLVISKN